ncbi:MAG: ABC transporter ATP-binding protein [Candidatus Manganitrophus sp.]|nr:ABC transporter ATP-binding protein [Candidatus Manganitrophus sp.]MDC4224348.1 ABC transporter ATP-binding protein [Candidatus Manganitrophus sp.]WDT70454.1 MAG: ABC transporter ATP-binding protein [Candidatus Manganitrophus sp.]
MAEVRLTGITKQFGEKEVLRGIDLTIEEGSFFTLVGPSGCGKSTLLSLIAGLESPTSGEILFDGAPVNDLAPKDRDVAVVFQSYALYPHMTVYDNVAFPLRMKKEPAAEIDRRVREVAELLGLTPLLPQRPGSLSGGQRQRVALGRAIVRKPRLFLFDEPLSNLDARLRIEMRSELKQLHRRLKTTMIYVTHDQAEAMTLSDRMAVLHQGTLQQEGTPKEIYARPANLFVAEFIGSPPMNLLRGRWVGEGIEMAEGVVFRLTGERAERFRDVPSGEVVLGIRPEDLHLSRPVAEAKTTAEIVLIESIGSEVWVELAWGGGTIRATAPADFDGTPGAQVGLMVDANKAHLFDARTGRRID